MGRDIPVKILLLEDSATDAELLERSLRKEGLAFTAMRAHTEPAFKQALSEFKPDIVLADYNLPSYNGRTALDFINQVYPDIPVIMVTGAIGEEKAVELLHAGARDYILKDRLTRLPSAIRRVLDEQEEVRVRRDSEKRLRESEERIRTILDTALDAVVSMDSSGLVVDWNAEAERVFGYTRDSALGRSMAELIIPPAYRDAHKAGLMHFMESGEGPILHSRVEIIAMRSDFSCFPAELSITVIYQGKETFFSAFVRDISERKKAEEQIRNLAFYDALTQLPNRRMLSDRLGQAMAASKRSGCYGALMFLDLDNFKPLNDKHGHDVGDLLLVEVARRLIGCVREMDTVARFGGDEFVVMLGKLDKDMTESTKQAGIVAEKIRLTLAEPYMLSARPEDNSGITVEHHCTASIGFVLFINHEALPEDIIKWADMAMYQAKSGGGNQMCLFDSAFEGKVSRKEARYSSDR